MKTTLRYCLSSLQPLVSPDLRLERLYVLYFLRNLLKTALLTLSKRKRSNGHHFLQVVDAADGRQSSRRHIRSVRRSQTNLSEENEKKKNPFVDG